jgi:hypothetical protein
MMLRFKSIPPRARGFTVVEVVVTVLLVASVLMAILALVRGAGQGSEHAGATTDAVQSVLIASECLRQDLARMLFVAPARDLALADGARSIGFRVPDGLGTDPWTLDYHPVHYETRPVQRQSDLFQLFRTESGRTLPVPTCYFKQVQFGYRPPVGRVTAFLEVNLVGCDAHGRGDYAASILLPLRFTVPPQPVELKGAS